MVPLGGGLSTSSDGHGGWCRLPPTVVHMSPAKTAFDDELARARLAFISAGQPALGAPRRAAADADEGPSVGEMCPPAATAASDSQVNAPRTRVLDRFFLTTRQVVAVLLLLLCGVVVALTVLNRSSASQLPLDPPVLHSATPSAAPSDTASPRPLVRVHVLGAVVSPGVVTVTDEAIVQDAVLAAGGLRADADPAELNLAAPVSDGQQVVVGTTTDPRGEVNSEQGARSPGTVGGPINLNTATPAELEELPGVGPVLAGQIVAWREQNDGFTTVDQLQEVSGIGPKSFAKLEPLVTT